MKKIIPLFNSTLNLIEKSTSPFSVFLLCLLLTFTLVGSVFQFDFGVFDDSDLNEQTLMFIDKWNSGNKLSPIIDGNPVVGRYFPGYYYYNMIRISLLEINIIKWHFFHLILYAFSGTFCCYIGRKITGSFIPGFIAYALLLSTGETDYSSNWINFITTFMFEGPLLFLWLLSVMMLVKVESSSNLFVKISLAVLSSLVIFAAIIFKENGFSIYISSLVSCATVYVLYCFYSKRTISKTLLITIVINIILAGLWGKNVLGRIPHNDSYGGTGTFNKDFTSIWNAAKTYFLILKKQADYLPIIGAVLLVSRSVKERKNISSSLAWSWSILGVSFIVFASLLVWPYQSGRYLQPAYFGILIVTCSEIYHAIRFGLNTQNQNPFSFGLGITLIHTLAIFLCCKIASQSPFVGIFEWIQILAIGVIFILSFTDKMNIRNALLLSQLLIIIFLILLQYCNLASFMKSEYNIKVGVYQKICRFIAETAPQNARVYWMLSKDDPGSVAWAAQANVRVIRNRPDITILPANNTYSEFGSPKKGDIIVDQTLVPNLEMAPMSQELKKTICQSDELFYPLKNLQDIKRCFINFIADSKSLNQNDFKTYFGSVQFNVYTVNADQWIPNDNAILEYFNRKF